MDHTGITFGTWDLLHPGHVVFLKECQERCKHLIIGLHVDPSVERPLKNKPIETVFERYMRLVGIVRGGCDSIIPYQTEQDLTNMLASFGIRTRFIGADYIGMETSITGYDMCKKTGVKIEYIPRYHNWSTSNTRWNMGYNT